MGNVNYAMRRERHITKAQIRAIKAMANKIYDTDEDYREALKGYGVESCKDLSRSQATNFIGKMSPAIHRPRNSKTRYYGTGQRGEQRHLTPEQAERISILEGLLGWNSVSTVSFIKKQVHKNKAVNMLANYEAVKVIVGMQKIAAGGDKELYTKLNNTSNAQLKEIGERA